METLGLAASGSEAQATVWTLDCRPSPEMRGGLSRGGSPEPVGSDAVSRPRDRTELDAGHPAGVTGLLEVWRAHTAGV